jgi:multiple sugar transport system substrate-binding protein
MATVGEEDSMFGRASRLRRLLLGSLALLAASGLAQPSFAEGPLAGGKSIRLLFVADPFAQIMQQHLAEFEKMSGGKIELEVVGYPETRNKTLLNSQNTESAYDVVSIDGVWMGEYAEDGVLMDLTDMVKGSGIDVNDFVPSIWEMGQVDGKQISVPVQPHPEMLEYRKDLFARDGIPEPKTWEDIIAAAKHFHGKDGMSGICWNGARGSALGQTVFHFVWAAGVKPISDDGRPQLDDPKAMDAANYLMDLMKYSPPGILNMAWDERSRAYAKGECAMLYEWAGRAYIWELDESSPARGNTAYVGAPAKKGVEPATSVGAWFLGIPANLPKDRVDLALKFIAWMVSPEMLKFSARNRNGTMPSYSVMRDPELIKMYPAFPIVDKLGQEGKLQPIRPPIPEFQQLSDVFGTIFHDMISGKLTPEQAVPKAQAEAMRVMGKS